MDSPELVNSHSDSRVSYRILDANLNRVMEGLRTLEDVARFQNLETLQNRFKSVRHALQLCTASWNQIELLRSRDSIGDVGRTFKTTTETLREAGLVDICQAAAQRVQQSLRCLEEVSKFVYPSSASVLESIRYQIYDINAQLLLAQQRDLSFLKQASLYVLVDCQMAIEDFAKRVKEISDAGVEIIQIRDKRMDASGLLHYTNAAIDVLKKQVTRVIINDRADVLQCTSAWGLHVGQTDLTVGQARSMMPGNCVLGLSTHDLQQVKDADQLGADYIGCGPTFQSETKKFDVYSGLEFLRTVFKWQEATEQPLPAFAIGGIRLENLPGLLETGIRRVAVSQAIWHSKSPGQEASKFRKLLDQAI